MYIVLVCVLGVLCHVTGAELSSQNLPPEAREEKDTSIWEQDGDNSNKVILNDGEIYSHESSSQYPGAVFVRWGRDDCPSTSQKLYSGIAGTSNHHRDFPGGGSNILCLPENPSFQGSVDGVGSERAFIYSVQYQISNFPAWEQYKYQDVTCAVCKATNRFSHVMIPARQSCPSGWTREYKGYLMAERNHPVHQRSTFICMDEDPEPVCNSGYVWANAGCGILDLVEPRCSTSGGGLSCGTYPDGKELTCAVCTL